MTNNPMGPELLPNIALKKSIGEFLEAKRLARMTKVRGTPHSCSPQPHAKAFLLLLLRTIPSPDPRPQNLTILNHTDGFDAEANAKLVPNHKRRLRPPSASQLRVPGLLHPRRPGWMWMPSRACCRS